MTRTYFCNSLLLPLLAGVCLALGSCAQKNEAESSKIALIKGEPVYLDELYDLGRIAHAKDPALVGKAFESEEGQKAFQQKAPNLYNTLIDTYVPNLFPRFVQRFFQIGCPQDMKPFVRLHHRADLAFL